MLYDSHILSIWESGSAVHCICLIFPTYALLPCVFSYFWLYTTHLHEVSEAPKSQNLRRSVTELYVWAPHLPWMKNKSTKTWSAWGGTVADLSKEKGPEPFPPWAFIRFIGTGIQIKLINHCQAVRIKQYITYRELEGLFWVTVN